MLIGPQLDAGEQARRSPSGSRPIRATTSPSRCCRCRACRRWSTAISKAGTSTCGRTSCTARTSTCLPGGLTRVALTQGLAGRQLVAGRRQQGHVGARRRSPNESDGRAEAIVRSQPRCRSERNAMLSRVADSIFWMSRYIERAENVARFIDVNLNLMLDLPGGVRAAVGAAGGHHRRPRADSRSGTAARRSETSSSFSRSTTRTPTRSSPACAPRARMPAPCARSSRRRCGRSSTSST